LKKDSALRLHQSVHMTGRDFTLTWTLALCRFAEVETNLDFEPHLITRVVKISENQGHEHIDVAQQCHREYMLYVT